MSKINDCLLAQGHIATVEEMLLQGHSWSEIGRRIGWDGPSVEQHYKWHAEATRPPDITAYGPKDVVLVGYVGSKAEVEGSHQMPCHQCGRMCWISPGSMDGVLDVKNKAGGKLYVICLFCVPNEILDQLADTDPLETLTDEQIKEMKEAGYDPVQMVKDAVGPGETPGQVMRRNIERIKRDEARRLAIEKLQRAAKNEDNK